MYRCVRINHTYEVLGNLKLWNILGNMKSSRISANICEKMSICWHTTLIDDRNLFKLYIYFSKIFGTGIACIMHN